MLVKITTAALPDSGTYSAYTYCNVKECLLFSFKFEKLVYS